jgi:hypothetical protein
MDETLRKLRNVATEQEALGTASFKTNDFTAAAVAFKHAVVATEAANAFEDATTETEVFSTRTPIVEIAGIDAEKRHAALLKIFARLRDVGTVRVFKQIFALEVAIRSHACSLEANMRVTNSIPLGCQLPLTGSTMNCVATLKA